MALSLAEAGTDGLDAVLVRLIGRPDLANSRGTLIHSLAYLDCSGHVDLLVRLVATGNYEVAHEALLALDTINAADDVDEAYLLVIQLRAQVDLEDWRRGLLDDLAEMFVDSPQP